MISQPQSPLCGDHRWLDLPFLLHRPFSFGYKKYRTDKDLDIEPDIPVVDVLLIEVDNLLKVGNVAAAADLPHSGDPRLDRKPCLVVRLVKVRL